MRRPGKLGALWQSIDKDALYAQLIDSDFGGGNTDSDGWVIKGGYAPVKNIDAERAPTSSTHQQGRAAEHDPGQQLHRADYDRLQLDVNYKF